MLKAFLQDDHDGVECIASKYRNASAVNGSLSFDFNHYNHTACVNLCDDPIWPGAHNDFARVYSRIYLVVR